MNHQIPGYQPLSPRRAKEAAQVTWASEASAFRPAGIGMDWIKGKPTGFTMIHGFWPRRNGGLPAVFFP